MSGGRLTQLWQMLVDGWQLLKEFQTAEVTDAFWEQFKARVEVLDRKHGESRFFRDIVIAVSNELERSQRGEYVQKDDGG